MATRAFWVSCLIMLGAFFALSDGPSPAASAVGPPYQRAAQTAAQNTQVGQTAPLVCWNNNCYRTYEQIAAYLQSVASAYPGIAELVTAGPSWEGTRQVWVMRMGNRARPDPRPVLFLVAEQRARDVATTEVLLRLTGYLAQHYGTDPDVTWLLDNRLIVLVPLANPDGYYEVYANAQCSRIKNTDNANGCSSALNWGTDLNRNYPYRWNTGGASSDPCDSSYPGPSALSEPESAHVLDVLVHSGTGLVLQLAAPSGTTGPSIRYPWGWTSEPPPDIAGLDALGWALARLNGTTRSAVTQHNRGGSTVISGILDDTAYNTGVPALTLNIGATPYLECSDLDALWRQQLPALLYAARATGPTPGDTLSRPFGPDPRDLLVSGGPGPDTLLFSAVLSSNTGTVEGAVYKVDDPGIDGAGEPMSGNFGGGIASVEATVSTAGIAQGRHLLFVQGRNSGNHWGVLSSIFFTVTAGLTTTPSPATTRTGTPTATATRTFSTTPTPTPTATTAPDTPTASTTATVTRTATPQTTPTCGTVFFPAPGTPAPIPTGTTTAYHLEVPAGGTLADVDVSGLTIWHDSIGELTLTLISPAGTRVLLAGGICGHSRNFENTCLDDGADVLIGSVCPPSPGACYRPASPLAALNGQAAEGTWTLEIANGTGYAGSLRSWGLLLTTGAGCATPTYQPTITATTTSSASPTHTRTPSETRTPSHTRTLTSTRTTTATRTATPTRTPRPPNTATPLPCVTYTDVHPSQYFYDAVNWLTCRGIVAGYSDNTFRPFNNATRAQLAKMVVVGEGWQIFEPSQPTFSDVGPGDWFYGVVETAAYHGIIVGYGDGTFRPHNNVTRGQLCKIIVLARGWTPLDPETAHFSDVPRGSAFYTYVETAQARGVVSGYGDGTFRPNANATRGQLSKMLYTALIQQPGPLR